ncbi:MAG: hypothetical protein EXR84_05390 [Gammaproteobacteria bacterium]|nr:hypothetical protein [Gammaproteobacteria bacterium]
MKQVRGWSAIFSVSLAMMFASSTDAQDFNLFEDIETTNDDQSAAQQRPGRESRVTASQPEFTLIGTSRIGDSYSVILTDRNGAKMVIKTEPGVNVPIPEYSEYQIVATAAGKVSVMHPDSIPCVEFPDSGIRCNSAGNIAELTLPNNPPVARSQEPAQLAITQVDLQPAEVIEENPQNPFEIMRARALNGDNSDNPAVMPDADGNGGFVPRRFEPSEVPPGMRVVSTPFGDRLVPQ